MSALIQVLRAQSAGNQATQLFFLGDSITFGIGTTGYGSSFSGIVPATDNDYCYPQQAYRLINRSDVAYVKRGFPGWTAANFNSSQLSNTITMFDKVNYSRIICVVFFGANEINFQSATTIINNLTTTHASLRAAGAKTIAVPVLNRKDSYSNASTNTVRNAVNATLASTWQNFADDYSGLDTVLYADNGPDNSSLFAANDADGLSKVHLTNAGAAILAGLISVAVQRQLLL